MLKTILFFSPVFLLFLIVITLYLGVQTNTLDFIHLYVEIPMSGVRCPTCLANGQESWVIPGKTCGYCGTGC